MLLMMLDTITLDRLQFKSLGPCFSLSDEGRVVANL